MAQRTSDIDPFAARGTNTVPPGTFDTDLTTASPARAATAATATGTAASTAGGGRPAPALSRASGARTGTSGKSTATPFYLSWAGIALIIAALLIALGLGVGLGVGLGLKNNDSKSDSAAADSASSPPLPALLGDKLASADAAATSTEYSTLSKVVTGDPSTTVVQATVTGSGTASNVVQTSYVGGSTVVVSVEQNTNSIPVVTVSETLAPSTQTQTVYRTTYASTETITTTLAGGAESTYFSTVTIRRTITADATARARRAKRDRLDW
ncbi:hypothetical protein JCM10213_006621 [Rhodosporidiobolus nylandii]